MPQPMYEVRVAGIIPAELLSQFDDLAITVERPETVIRGCLPDQSAAVGLISRIHGLGLGLIEVRRLAAVVAPVRQPRD